MGDDSELLAELGEWSQDDRLLRETIRRATMRLAKGKRLPDAAECAKELLREARDCIRDGRALPTPLADYFVAALTNIADGDHDARKALHLDAPEGGQSGKSVELHIGVAAFLFLARRRDERDPQKRPGTLRRANNELDSLAAHLHLGKRTREKLQEGCQPMFARSDDDHLWHCVLTYLVPRLVTAKLSSENIVKRLLAVLGQRAAP